MFTPAFYIMKYNANVRIAVPRSFSLSPAINKSRRMIIRSAVSKSRGSSCFKKEPIGPPWRGFAGGGGAGCGGGGGGGVWFSLGGVFLDVSGIRFLRYVPSDWGI